MRRRRRASQDFGALATAWREAFDDTMATYKWHALSSTMDSPADRAAVVFSAATGLEVLGVGGARAVFALDDKRVLKLPFHDGWACNEIEEETWRLGSRRARRWLAPVRGMGPKGSWLVMARARKLTLRLGCAVEAGRFARVGRAFGVDDVNSPLNWGLIGHRMVIIDYGYFREQGSSRSIAETL